MAQYLQVGLVLDELLCAAVQQADVGVTLLHGLSAELQDETQHAVSRRVLGPKVELNIPHKLLRQLESTSRWWRLQRRREMLNEA